MPFDFRSFFQAFKLAYAEGPRPQRFVGLTLLLLFFPGVAITNAICLGLDKLFFRGFLKVEVKAPVFIVGNARSGTTFMHRLMCRDTERFTYFKAWEIFFPSLIQKKLIRGIGAIDGAIFGGLLKKGIHRFEDKAFARFRELHPLSLTGSEEDETMFVHCFSSSFICVLFPYLKEMRYLHFFDERPEAERKKLMTFYKEMVQRQLYLDGGDRTLCSKNPLFSTKMRSLLEFFPDARFVYMARNPYESLPSVQSMLYTIWESAWIDVEKDGEPVRLLGQYSVDAYNYALGVLDELPQSAFATVRYDELVVDPGETVRQVYGTLGLEVSPAYEAILQEETAKQKSYKSRHTYSLEEFGLSREQVRAELGHVFVRFDWDPAA